MNTPIYARCVEVYGDPQMHLEYLRKRYAMFRLDRMIGNVNNMLCSIMGLLEIF